MKIDARLGAFGIVPDFLNGGIITGNFWAFDVDKRKVNIEWFNLFTSSGNFYEICNKASSGTTHRKYLDENEFLNFEIDLPEVHEQNEFIIQYQEYRKKFKTLEDEIVNQQTYLQQLRQSILLEAVQGKLTSRHPELVSGSYSIGQEMPKQVRHDEEDAATLLQRITAEKQQLIGAGKLKKEKELLPITENEIPFELPKGWVWCRLGEAGQINPRNQFDDNKESSFIPMTLISSEFGETPKFEIRKWKDIKSGFTHFTENDVAVAKITPCFENSKAGIFRGLINGVGAGTTELHVFRGNSTHILPEYVYLFFKSPSFLKEGESRMTGSAGQKRVPSDFVKNVLFPLPPVSEQHRIVVKVQQLLQMVNLLEQQVQQSQTQAQQLLQAVLKGAFSGEAKVYGENELVAVIEEN